ncbi:hypothetical protein D3C77_300100 [compost metagenome]
MGNRLGYVNKSMMHSALQNGNLFKLVDDTESHNPLSFMLKLLQDFHLGLMFLPQALNLFHWRKGISRVSVSTQWTAPGTIDTSSL